VGLGGIDGFAAERIRIKARQLVGKGGFTESDVDDIEQELRLDLLKRFPDYDAARGSWEGFISGVLDHRIGSLVASRMAEKRDWRRVAFSLNEMIPDGEGEEVERVATMPADEPEANIRALAFDLAKALADLPPKLRRLCKNLQDTNITEIAREEGVSRKTVYGWIKKIRERLEDRGLHHYL